MAGIRVGGGTDITVVGADIVAVVVDIAVVGITVEVMKIIGPVKLVQLLST